jgi:hypothetical protein
MGERRFRFGVLVSIVWLLCIALGLYLQRDMLSAMTPNTWGDFFAGSFSPLAFLWLVLGYLQQGEELRLSTEALRLQADELKHSVEQQRALVEVSRQQVEAERDALTQEQHRREEAVKPFFDLNSSGGAFGGDGRSTYGITLVNIGNAALGLAVSLKHQDERTSSVFFAQMFDRGERKSFNLQFDRPELVTGCFLTLSFRDGLSRPSQIAYRLDRESNDPHASLVLELVENRL